MLSKKIVFRISDNKYEKLRNWQRAIEEKIRNREIETGKTWDDVPIPQKQIEMLKNGEVSIHWGYCSKPYSYEFSPQHPNASILSEQLQYVYGPLILIRVTNNLTGDSIDLNQAFSEWDVPFKRSSPLVSLIRGYWWTCVKIFRHLRFRVFGPPGLQKPIELGGFYPGSDAP